jgi:ribosomal protein S27AE
MADVKRSELDCPHCGELIETTPGDRAQRVCPSCGEPVLPAPPPSAKQGASALERRDTIRFRRTNR